MYTETHKDTASSRQEQNIITVLLNTQGAILLGLIQQHCNNSLLLKDYNGQFLFAVLERCYFLERCWTVLHFTEEYWKQGGPTITIIFGQYWDHDNLTCLFINFGNIVYLMNFKKYKYNLTVGGSSAIIFLLKHLRQWNTGILSIRLSVMLREMLALVYRADTMD